MIDEISRAVSATRSRLNALILVSRTLSWAAPSALGAGLVAIGFRLLGLPTAGFVALAALTFAGSAAGFIRGLSARIPASEAARWIDERLGSKELVSAAYLCVGRGRAGFFDDLIVAKAAELAPAAMDIPPPLRGMARRAVLALAACAAATIFVTLVQEPDPNPMQALKRAPLAQASARKVSSPDPAFDPSRPEAAAAFASSLFPDDKRQATLAERALREGRLDDFRDLLKNADLKLQDSIKRSVSEPEKRRLVQEQERLRDASRQVAQGGLGSGKRGLSIRPGSGSLGPREEAGDGSSEGGQAREGAGSPEGRGEGFSPSDEGSAAGQGGSGGKATEPGAGGENPLEGGGEGGAGDLPRGGTGGWGIGEGAQGAWDRIQPKAGTQEAVLGMGKNQSYFEFILPGKAAATPLSELLPSSARSAEAALSREGLPLEYRDFVRSYFMALSKGETQ